MHIPFNSLNLGIFEWIIQQLVSILGSLISVVIKLFEIIITRFLYSIGSQLLSLVDFVQDLFRRLAGLETYWYNGQEMTNTIGQTPTLGGTFANDPVLSILGDRRVQEVFIAMTIIAVSVLIMAAVVQIIRVQYTQEGAKNTVGNIVGQTLKALAMFLIVPVGSVMGIFISNQLLAAIDGATNQTGSSRISSAIFLSAASGANRMRLATQDDDFSNNVIWTAIESAWNLTEVISSDDNGNIMQSGADNGGMFTSNEGTKTQRAEAIARKIDLAFTQNYQNVNTNESFTWQTLTGIDVTNGLVNSLITGSVVMGVVSGVGGLDTQYFSYRSQATVTAYYSLSSINYLVIFIAGVLVLWALFSAVFGLIARFYKIAILFMISPATVGIMPLDGGNAFEAWRTQFLGGVLAAYGVVVSLNLFILLLPVLEQIKIFDPNSLLGFSNYAYNNFIYLLFVIVGCFVFKNMVSTISKMFGADDAFAEGAGMAGKVMSAAVSGVAAVATGGVALGAKGMASSAAKKGKSLMKQRDAAFAEGRLDDAAKLDKEAKRANFDAERYGKIASAMPATKAVGGFKKKVMETTGLSSIEDSAKALKGIGLTSEKAWNKNEKKEADDKLRAEADEGLAKYKVEKQAAAESVEAEFSNLMNRTGSAYEHGIKNQAFDDSLNAANKLGNATSASGQNKAFDDLKTELSSSGMIQEEQKDLLQKIETALKGSQSAKDRYLAIDKDPNATAAEKYDAKIEMQNARFNLNNVLGNAKSTIAENKTTQENEFNLVTNVNQMVSAAGTKGLSHEDIIAKLSSQDLQTLTDAVARNTPKQSDMERLMAGLEQKLSKKIADETKKNAPKGDGKK